MNLLFFKESKPKLITKELFPSANQVIANQVFPIKHLSIICKLFHPRSHVLDDCYDIAR